MAMTINTNVASLNAQRNLSTSQGMLAQSIQRLSSGLRVNSAKDDAAGLAIAERMNGQIKGFSVATRNASDAISLAQTAEGALSTIGDNLQRMRELAVQSSNGTNSSSDRTNLNAEFSQLAAEITRTIGGTSFNSTNLFGATAASGFTFQIGANNVASTDQIAVSGTDLTTNTELASGGTVIGGNISTLSAAQTMLADIDTAINTVTTQRSTWGATQNRFEAVISNLKVTSENLSAARGRIMDTDFATETANLTKSQILQQAGTAMLAQANQTPQSVLSLLK
jgi:flagellin